MAERIMIAVDPGELETIREALVRLERRLDGATITPRNEWELMSEHASRAGVQTQTVRKWVREGRIDSRRVGAKTYVRANPVA